MLKYCFISLFIKGVAAIFTDNKPAGIILCFMQFKYGIITYGIITYSCFYLPSYWVTFYKLNLQAFVQQITRKPLKDQCKGQSL